MQDRQRPWLSRASYGRLVINLATGAGAALESAIIGDINALILDEIGSPTLVIENSIYTVSQLHGAWSLVFNNHRSRLPLY